MLLVSKKCQDELSYLSLCAQNNVRLRMVSEQMSNPSPKKHCRSFLIYQTSPEHAEIHILSTVVIESSMSNQTQNVPAGNLKFA